ncbi:MAG: dUTP diphosphatase [Dehalococcoidia bacterium]|nr:dUTP diphosphatase [Dehalococcoidia bacterium]
MDGAIPLRVRRLRPGARTPERQSDLASGFDVHACLEDGPLLVGEAPVRVPTGIAIAAPAGIDVQVRPRSGLTARGVITAFGTVDADFRGELHVTMYCLPSTGSFEVRDGDRIAQVVVSRLAPVVWQEVASLDDTERGVSGWGSTGV